MKFVFLIGSGAVGKMTVGQELAKITDLRLFHNHMAIEPVIDILGHYDAQAVMELRDVVFRHFAASDNYGMIFTYLWAFDQQEDWDYIEHVKSIFAPYGTEFYCAELVAPLEVRLERNKTENRLRNKRSKRDLVGSEERMLNEEARYRTVSMEQELPFERYIRIDNSNLTAEEAAAKIKDAFSL